MHVWVAGKTVWSLVNTCHTWVLCGESKRYTNVQFTVLYFCVRDPMPWSGDVYSTQPPLHISWQGVIFNADVHGICSTVSARAPCPSGRHPRSSTVTVSNLASTGCRRQPDSRVLLSVARSLQQFATSPVWQLNTFKQKLKLNLFGQQWTSSDVTVAFMWFRRHNTRVKTYLSTYKQPSSLLISFATLWAGES